MAKEIDRKRKYVIRRRRHTHPWHIKAKQGSDMIKQTQKHERELKHLKVVARKQYKTTVAKEKADKLDAQARDILFEKHTKNANAIVRAERSAAVRSEIQHKEAVQVHTKFIANEIFNKEKKQKFHEKASKKEMLVVTQELNDKYRSKKPQKPENGGGWCTEGSFTLMSDFEEKEKAVKA